MSFFRIFPSFLSFLSDLSDKAHFKELMRKQHKSMQEKKEAEEARAQEQKEADKKLLRMFIGEVEVERDYTDDIPPGFKANVTAKLHRKHLERFNRFSKVFRRLSEKDVPSFNDEKHHGKMVAYLKNLYDSLCNQDCSPEKNRTSSIPPPFSMERLKDAIAESDEFVRDSKVILDVCKEKFLSLFKDTPEEWKQIVCKGMKYELSHKQYFKLFQCLLLAEKKFNETLPDMYVIAPARDMPKGFYNKYKKDIEFYEHPLAGDITFKIPYKYLKSAVQREKRDGLEMSYGLHNLRKQCQQAKNIADMRFEELSGLFEHNPKMEDLWKELSFKCEFEELQNYNLLLNY